MSTYHDILKLIQDNDDWSIDSVTAVMIVIAEATISHLEEDSLLRLIHKKSGYALVALRREFAQVRTEYGNPPTDLGVAVARKVLETQFEKGRFLIRIRGMGFHHFIGAHWQPLDVEALRKRIMPTVLQLKAHFGKRTAASVAAEVLTCIGDLIDLHDPTNTPKNVINTMNGELWLKDSGLYELKAHSPESRLFWVLPYDYSPEAKATLYGKSIRQIFARCSEPEEVVRYWEEFLGYVIQPDRFVTSVWFMIGSGSNGKSTALRILLKLMGPVAHSCDFKSFSNDFFKYRALFNMLLLVDEDFKKDLVLNEAFLKKLSESGWHTARSPHKMDSITFQNTVAPLLVGNHYPQTTDVSYGWRRRINVFPFDRQFTKDEVDVDLFEKIESTEMPGILNLALAGYARICQRGRVFKAPKDCAEAAEVP